MQFLLEYLSDFCERHFVPNSLRRLRGYDCGHHVLAPIMMCPGTQQILGGSREREWSLNSKDSLRQAASGYSIQMS
jgi:hypothetical protein